MIVAGASPDMIRLLQRIQQLEADNDALRQRLRAMEEEKAQQVFKNKLLCEMLAVAQLDAESAAEQLQKEKLKVDALKWELARLNLHRAM
jgi:hypothetical protein